MNEYDVAQICENGHLITPSAQKNPEDCQPFCDECGQPTIKECKECKEQIKGYKRFGGIGVVYEYACPKFCHRCGKPYPWTEKTLDATKKYVGEIKELKPEERELLIKNIEDIVKATPSQQISIFDFKKLLAKMNSASREMIIALLKDIFNETVKKTIGM